MAARRLAALLAGILAAVASPAAAQKATPGQVAYVEGLRAFDAGDYGTAASRMRSAVAEDPREATARFRYRAQNAEDYFPHLWLGLCLEKLGDREAALPSLRESQRQGAVEARPALRRILASALARVTPPTPVPTPFPEASPTPRPAAPLPEPPAVPLSTATPSSPVPSKGAPGLPAVRPVIPVPATASAAPPPATIRAGLRAFFLGDYAGAERLLSTGADRSPVARLFLAWSLGGRYLLEEPRDAGLLGRARTEYAAALAAGAPSTRGPWVSPAILSLFGAGDAAR
jgi:tetratricopeptide (TPR) repeat protein